MASGTLLGANGIENTRTRTGPPSRNHNTIAQGLQPGIVSWDRIVVVCDGQKLWKSINRGVGFVEEPLPGGIVHAATNRVGIGQTAQGLLVCGVGEGRITTVRSGVTVGGSDSMGSKYFVLEDVSDTGVFTWSEQNADASSARFGLNYLTQLPWPTRLTGGADRIYGVAQQSDYRFEGSTSRSTLIWLLRLVSEGFRSSTSTAISIQTALGDNNIATYRGFYLASDWSIDIEHSGNDGTTPLQGNPKIWFCGPRVNTRSKPSRGWPIQIGRYDPAVGTIPNTATVSTWTNAIGPCNGIWTGNRFIVAQAVPSTTGATFLARSYLTPTRYESLPVSPKLTAVTAEPAAIRLFLTDEGFGVVCLGSLTLTSNKPSLWYITYKTLTGWDDEWTDLTDFTGSPSITSGAVAGMLNVDRFPPDNSPRAQIIANSNSYFYQDLVSAEPVATRIGPVRREALASAILNLNWAYSHNSNYPQNGFLLRRERNDPLTNAPLADQWYDLASQTWVDAEVWNTTSDAHVGMPGGATGWAGADSGGIFSSPIRFVLQVRDTQPNADTPSVISDETVWQVDPFARLARFTIITPAADAVVTSFVTVTAQFPADAADRKFEPSLLPAGTVFAAEYILQVHEPGKANLVSSGWQQAVFPAGSTAPFEVSYTFPQIPNGDRWIARAQWRTWAYPRSSSNARFQNFDINLAPPTQPTVNVRALSDDRPPVIKAGLTGLINNSIALRVTVSGTIGPLPGEVVLERREVSRSDHRPVSSETRLFVLPTPYTTGQVWDDYTVQSGVQYQYRARTANSSGAAIIGAWVPA